jgi:hypothetical protein
MFEWKICLVNDTLQLEFTPRSARAKGLAGGVSRKPTKHQVFALLTPARTKAPEPGGLCLYQRSLPGYNNRTIDLEGGCARAPRMKAAPKIQRAGCWMVRCILDANEMATLALDCGLPGIRATTGATGVSTCKHPTPPESTAQNPIAMSNGSTGTKRAPTWSLLVVSAAVVIESSGDVNTGVRGGDADTRPTSDGCIMASTLALTARLHS